MVRKGRKPRTELSVRLYPVVRPTTAMELEKLMKTHKLDIGSVLDFLMLEHEAIQKFMSRTASDGLTVPSMNDLKHDIQETWEIAKLRE